MKILHILLDGPSKLSSAIIAAQSKTETVKVIDMSKKEASYEAIVDAMVSNDKVVAW